jgi:hypothetical protein
MEKIEKVLENKPAQPVSPRYTTAVIPGGKLAEG